MNTFGEWLQQQRRQRRLTREEFAKRVGCSVSALQKIEYGERHPSAQIAELMANCLDVPSEARSTFVRVARGELSVSHLLAELKPTTPLNISAPQSNLPIFPTPLIGRDHELEQLNQLLRDPQCRLLTLVGAGGVGKTRLAVETATRVQDFFERDVYFIPLAPVTTTSFIVPIIANALGFVFQGAGGADPKTQLFNYLAEQQLLLLTDNLEHLLSEPGIEVLSELLANAPHVKLLATSREALNLQEEWVFEVHGLSVPANPEIEGFAQGNSVELFLQRARRAQVEFNATPEDFPAIFHICRLVDGMPLAIELAATWVRALTCAEIAVEIERSLDFLSISARDMPARHRSMRAVFDHSWKLLPEEEKQVLMRLSVFRDGFRREAAEQVAAASLAVLSALVMKSLIRRSGTGRYHLHELIQQFVAEQLLEQPEEQTAARVRHCQHYLTYFGQADQRLRSSLQHETLVELTAEIDNFRAAWDWAVTHGEFALIEQTLRTFWMLYDTRGWLLEGTELLDYAVSVLESVHGAAGSDFTNQVALAHILTCQGILATRLGQLEQAQATLQRALEILRRLDAPHVLVETIALFGVVMEFSGDYPGAAEFYTEGLEIASTLGDRWYAALCRLLLAGEGSLRLPTNTPENSHAQLQSVVAEWRTIGDPRLTAAALQNLSWMAVKLGFFDEARAALEESVALNTAIGDRWNLGFAYRGLGLIAQAQGEHQQAVDMFSESQDTFTEVGARQDTARVQVEMSYSIFALGNDAEAERGWCEALRITLETQGIFVALDALVGIATLNAKQGNIKRALELLFTVLNHPASLPETKNRANDLRVGLEAQLTSQQVAAVSESAQVKTFETIVEEVLRRP